MKCIYAFLYWFWCDFKFSWILIGPPLLISVQRYAGEFQLFLLHYLFPTYKTWVGFQPFSYVLFCTCGCQHPFLLGMFVFLTSPPAPFWFQSNCSHMMLWLFVDDRLEKNKVHWDIILKQVASWTMYIWLELVTWLMNFFLFKISAAHLDYFYLIKLFIRVHILSEGP